MKIASASIDITPLVQCPLGGGERPQKVWQTLDSKLEANLILIQDNLGPRLLVALDLLYVGAFLTNGIREFALKYVSTENIWISASHTHNAPATDSGRPKLGKSDNDYLAMVLSKIQNGIDDLFKESLMHEVNLIVREGFANHTVNRRRKRLISVSRRGFKLNKVLLAPNERGPKDERITRLDFVKSSGQVVAAIWHFTCHPVSHFGELTISSGFPGVVREKMRIEMGEFPVVFLNGFAGDVRPPAIRSLHENPILWILLGRTFRRFSKREYFEWATSLALEVLSTERLNIRMMDGVRPAKRLVVDSTDFILESQSPNVVLQSFPVGDVLLVGISAEPSVELGVILKGIGTTQHILPCGYIEEVFGYLPTSQQIKEGGYEGGEFVTAFNAGSINSRAPHNFWKWVRILLEKDTIEENSQSNGTNFHRAQG